MTRSSTLARASKRAVRQYVSDYELPNVQTWPHPSESARLAMRLANAADDEKPALRIACSAALVRESRELAATIIGRRLSRPTPPPEAP